MTNFKIKKLPYELTSNAGLALIGQYFNRMGISQRLDAQFPVGKAGIAYVRIPPPRIAGEALGVNTYHFECWRTCH